MSTAQLIQKTITDFDKADAARDAQAAAVGLPVVPRKAAKPVKADKPKTEPKAKVKPEPKAKVKPEPKAKVADKPKTEPKAKVKAELPKVVKPKGDPKLAVFGHPVTAVVRCLGKAGFSFKETVAALASKNVATSPNTIRIFLSAGKTGQRGAPAPLTEAQVKELKDNATASLAQAAAAKAEVVEPAKPEASAVEAKS